MVQPGYVYLFIMLSLHPRKRRMTGWKEKSGIFELYACSFQHRRKQTIYFSNSAQSWTVRVEGSTPPLMNVSSRSYSGKLIKSVLAILFQLCSVHCVIRTSNTGYVLWFSECKRYPGGGQCKAALAVKGSLTAGGRKEIIRNCGMLTLNSTHACIHVHAHAHAHWRQCNHTHIQSYLHTGHVTDISGMHFRRKHLLEILV